MMLITRTGWRLPRPGTTTISLSRPPNRPELRSPSLPSPRARTHSCQVHRRHHDLRREARRRNARQAFSFEAPRIQLQASLGLGFRNDLLDEGAANTHSTMRCPNAYRGKVPPGARIAKGSHPPINWRTPVRTTGVKVGHVARFQRETRALALSDSIVVR